MNSLSNFFKPKEKICKCGHDKSEHYKKPKTLWSSLSDCNLCKCSSYMNRKLPNGASIFSLCYGIFLMGFIGVALIVFYPMLQDTTEIKIHNSVLGGIIEGMFIIIGVFVFNSSGLFTYFSEKRRKTYPIEKRNEQE